MITPITWRLRNFSLNTTTDKMNAKIILAPALMGDAMEIGSIVFTNKDKKFVVPFEIPAIDA